MFTLLQAYFIPFLIAILIGLATGKWIWSRYAADGYQTFGDETPRSYVDEGANDDDATNVAAAFVADAPVAKVKVKPAKKPTKAKQTRQRAPKKDATPKMTAIGVAAAVGPPDDLLQIKGVGPKLNALMISLGITRFDQIAQWTALDVAKVDKHLGNFSGRIVRDQWVHQASLLAVGDIEAFEDRYGTLDSENR